MKFFRNVLETAKAEQAEATPTVEPIVEATPIECETCGAPDCVCEAPAVEETLEDKFAIPEIEPIAEVQVPSESVTNLEEVYAIPEGATIVEGVELVGEPTPEVAQQLEEYEIGGDTPVVEPTPEPVAEPQPDPISAEETVDPEVNWIQFVDTVILPTLITCVDKVKDYVTNVLADELRKAKPE